MKRAKQHLVPGWLFHTEKFFHVRKKANQPVCRFTRASNRMKSKVRWMRPFECFNWRSGPGQPFRSLDSKIRPFFRPAEDGPESSGFQNMDSDFFAGFLNTNM